MQNKTRLHEFIQAMPKVELHVHLEGSIAPETLQALSLRNNIDLPVRSESDLKKIFKFRDFKHFVEIYNLITCCLKTIEDFELISYKFGCDRARQNIKYSEVTFSLGTNCQLTGLSWQEILGGLNAGRLRAKKEFDVEWRWIFDILRDDKLNSKDWISDAVIAGKNQGVVALGLSGYEDSAPASVFVDCVSKVQISGLGFVPHTGETHGSQSMREVLNLLKPDRIGHGVHCIEDSTLMFFLKQHKIPLEVCPTSNICTGIYPDFGAHPLKKLWDYGLFITVNSDDPALFGTDLSNEYWILVKQFGLELDALLKMSLNSVFASFLSEREKQKMYNDFKSKIAELRREFDV